jgi:hypothetical protein
MRAVPTSHVPLSNVDQTRLLVSLAPKSSRRGEHRASPEPGRSNRRAARARRRGRLLPVAATLAVLAGGLILALSSGGGSSRGTVASSHKAARAHHPVETLRAELAPRPLPSSVSGESLATRAGRVLVIGGLSSSDVSTSDVLQLSPRTGITTSVGALSEVRHDTAAALLGSQVLVFGGGSASELNSVESLTSGAAGTVIGHLPTTRSDLSALTLDGRVYVLGGYDGNAPTPIVLRTANGRGFSDFATLPVAFRYAAVVALGSSIYMFGGELADGLDSDAIQRLDTGTGRARIIGRLPRALSHASAVALGGRAYILGGRTREVATDRVLSFDPQTGKVRSAGRLPLAVTNAAATVVGDRGYLIGGLGAHGETLASVIEVRLVSRGQ